MTKITKLTKEQEALIPVVRDEWINRLGSGQPIDTEKARAGIEWLYELSGLKKPLVIFVDSPLAAQYAVWIAQGLLSQSYSQMRERVGQRVGRQVREQVDLQGESQGSEQVASQMDWQVELQVGSRVRRQVELQVGEQVRRQVREQVDSQVGWQVALQVGWRVREQVDLQVGEQVRRPVDSQVGSRMDSQVVSQMRERVGRQVGWQVGEQVGLQVHSQVRRQVELQVRRQVELQVGEQVRRQVDSQVLDRARRQVLEDAPRYSQVSLYGNCSDYGWVAYYDFFQRVGVDLKRGAFDKFKDLLKSNVYETIQLDGLCIVCSLPSKIFRNEEGRLHSSTGPAIEWADGYRLYSLHGVVFKEELFNQVTAKDVDPKVILSIVNIEQRMAALRTVDQEKLISKLDHKVIDRSSRGNELLMISDLIPKKKVYALRYKCPSTGRQYVSFVRPEAAIDGDADAAMASRHNVTREAFKKLKNHS